MQVWESLFRDSKDAIILADAESGVILDANPKAEELLGRPVEEIIGMHQSMIHPEEHAAYYKTLFREAAKYEQTHCEHIFVRHSDGRLIPVAASTSLMQAGGKTIAVGLFRPLGKCGSAHTKPVLSTEQQLLSTSVTTHALEYYRCLFENAHDAIMIFRPDDEQILEVNARACELYGFDVSEFIGMSLKEISQDIPRGKQYVSQTLEQGIIEGFETTHYRKDGSKMLLYIKASVVEYNREPAILTVNSDITEQRAKEKQLRESEMRYEMATAAAHVGVWDWDAQTKQFYLDSNIKAMLGYRDDEIPNDVEIWSQYIHPDDRESVIAAARAHFDGLTPEYLHEHRMLHKDGQERWFMLRGHAIRDDEGNVVRMIGTDTDITERKRAESALQISEEWYRSLIELGSTVYAVIDAQGKVLYESPSLEHVLGWKPEDVHGKSIFSHVHPDDLAAAISNLGTLVDSPGVAKVNELRYRHSDYSWRQVEIRGMNLLDNPAVGGIVLTAHDVTERKRLEQERRDLEVQIRQVQKLESLGVLAGGIAHDFNNLLMGILGNAELILDRVPAKTPVAERVEKISMTAKRAAELTQQILAFAGKGSLSVEPLSINQVVKEMGYLLETSTSKYAELSYQFHDNLPSIEADITQVRQVIMNLVQNASEAIGKKSGVVTVTTDAVVCDRAFLRSTQVDDNLPEGLYACLEVSDSGSGIDEANREKIFDPFFSTKFTGRGLGLASTMGIVRGHKGAIKVTSTPEQGTTFSVLFPASKKPVMTPPPEPESTEGWQGSGTALIVDDEETVRDVTRSMLESLGFKVLTANNGNEGVALFHRHAHELSVVLLDLLMPVMDGATALPLMLKAGRDVPIVLMSGYSEQEVTKLFPGEAFAGFLKKPYELQHLTNLLREVTES